MIRSLTVLWNWKQLMVHILFMYTEENTTILTDPDASNGRSERAMQTTNKLVSLDVFFSLTFYKGDL